MSYRVLIVEDHKIMRDGIKALLDRSSEFAVVGDVETGTEAIQICAEIRPDIVLMDIGLPGLNGVDSTAELLRHCPQPVPVLVLESGLQGSKEAGQAVGLGLRHARQKRFDLRVERLQGLTEASVLSPGLRDEPVRAERHIVGSDGVRLLQGIIAKLLHSRFG